jgi:hypothetical protein
MLDVKRLIGEVTAQNGIRLEPNDPAFALVTLNQLVLEDTATRLLGQVSATLAQFAESLSKGEHLAGKTLAQEVKAAAIEARKEWAAEVQAMQPGSATNLRCTQPAKLRWFGAGVLLGMMVTLTGMGLYRLIVG